MSGRVHMAGDVAEVRFADFGADAYEMFLRVKRLPEKRLSWDWRAGAYTVTTPARFARILDPAMVLPERTGLPLAAHLFDYQAWITRRALDAKRFACWADAGLGKTAVFLEWARQVVALTGGRVLIFSPPSIIDQTCGQSGQFYGGALPVEQLRTREEMAAWCRLPGSGVAITGYHKMVAGKLDDLRHLAGVVADESSVLKTGGGVIKWNLIHSARGIEYKLSCTATPAPNDTMEYASQAAFLETIRHEGEVLWTWFRRGKDGEWYVKPHARASFYAWMSSWSIYLRDPARFGWRDVLADLPEPEWVTEELPLTGAQNDAMLDVISAAGGGMFAVSLGVTERTKLAQVARGFLYRGTGKERTATTVESVKPARVAEIARQEVKEGRPVIIWTVFDEEAAIIRDLLADLDPVTVDGSTPEAARPALLASFTRGGAMILISKAQVGGYGLNLQRAKSVVFSGFDDSQERMYQAVRRAYRLGQTDKVRVFVPYVPELEGLMFENVQAKERRFAAEAAAQEDEYLRVIQNERAA